MVLGRLIPVVVFGLDGLPMPTAWTAALWLRAKRMFVTKLVGTTLWTWAFFVGYFQLLRFPNGAVTIVPVTALDRLIPFQPRGADPLPVAVDLRRHRAGPAAALPAAPRLRGLDRPSAPRRPRPLLVVADSRAARRLRSARLPGLRPDARHRRGGNACPSMHVAIAIYTVVWVEVQLRQIGVPAWLRVVNVAWFAAITYSTLALKQHVLLDVVAGAVLGALFAAASLRWRPRD